MEDLCKTDRRKIALLLAYMSLIVASSLIPMDREISGLQFIIELKPLIQNLLHIPAYAVLAILLFQLLRIYKVEGRKRIVLLVACAVGFGLLNELIQLAVPGRYPSLVDMVLNVIGILVGAWLYSVIEKGRPGFLRRIVCE